jgi:hypothetical protein
MEGSYRLEGTLVRVLLRVITLGFSTTGDSCSETSGIDGTEEVAEEESESQKLPLALLNGSESSEWITESGGIETKALLVLGCGDVCLFGEQFA